MSNNGFNFPSPDSYNHIESDEQGYNTAIELLALQAQWTVPNDFNLEEKGEAYFETKYGINPYYVLAELKNIADKRGEDLNKCVFNHIEWQSAVECATRKKVANISANNTHYGLSA